MIFNNHSHRNHCLRFYVVFICPLLILLSQVLCAQTLRFQYLPTDTETTVNSVNNNDNTIIQDQRGFLWLGTVDGLNRYDGYSFKTYKYNRDNPHSLSNNSIRVLYEDTQGTLWIGTDYGLNRFDPMTQSFIRYYHIPDDSTSLSANQITSIVEDKPGKLWIGTVGGGLNYFDSQSGQSLRYSSNKNNPYSLSGKTINALIKDTTGALWIGTAHNGLNRFIDVNQQFIQYHFDKDNPNSIGNESVQALHEDRQGNLWVGTLNGISRLDKKRQNFTRLLYNQPNSALAQNQHIQSFAEDRQGGIWIGIYGNGLSHFNPDTEKFNFYRFDASNRNSLCSDYIASLYLDNHNRVWINTISNKGFCYFFVDQQQFNYYPAIATNPIAALLEDKAGTLWIGTFGGGLYQIDPVTEQITHHYHDKNNPHSLSGNRIMALHEDNSGTLWIGAHGGLNRYDPVLGHFLRYPNSPSQILALSGDEKGRLWIGSIDKGLSQFNKTKGRFTAHNDAGKIDYGIGALYSNFKGTLWMGSSTGFIRYIPEHESYTYYQHINNNPNSLSDNYVLSLYEDDQGILWIGAATGWLNRFDPKTERFNHFGKTDSLSSRTMYGIVNDEQGNLWISTNKGLSMFNPTTKLFKSYKVEDGLQGNDFGQGAYFKSAKGELFFGGEHGYNRFYPHQITDNKIKPHLLFTDFRLDNKSVPIHREQQTDDYSLTQAIYATDSLPLTHKERFFSFEFAAINAPKPKNVKYAYKLEGWDNHWLYTDYTNRIASYTNIAAGDYTLKVKAIDMNGIWGETTTAIKITILPPFWKTTLAYLMYLLLAVIAIVATINLRTRSLQQRAQQLEKTIQARTQEILTQKLTIESLLSKKDEFFANVSHEFRTPLTLITGPVTQVLNETRNKKIKHILAPALLNAKRLLRMVDQLLDLARLDSTVKQDLVPVDLSATLQRITTSMSSLVSSQELSVSTRLEPGLFINANVSDIEKIIVNLLSNAIKYTPKGGHISITANRINNDASFSIKDNGPGISKEDQSIIFDRFVRLDTPVKEHVPGAGIGLALVKQLVLYFGGQIDIDSEHNDGACFTVSFPRLNIIKHSDNDIADSNCIEQEIAALQTAQPTHSTLLHNDHEQLIGEKATVLIIEDHLDMRLFIQQELTDSYRCLLAEDGLVGIKVALKEVPDLIITDLMMPKKSGFELASVVRNDIRTSHIPIIMLTAKADEQSRMHAWKSDIDDYIEKPFNIDELLLRCENLISIRRVISQRLSSEIIYNTAKSTPTLNDKDSAFIENLKTLVATRYADTKLNATIISKELAMSESQLQRKIKALLGQSVPDYIRTFRLQKGAELLRQKNKSATEVAYAVGFSSPAYFSSCFKAHYGMTAKTYQAQNS